ncbi:hypothetical protein [Nocardia sp. NBC_01377]|uniref:hypothetical protein n=1 Tax=Nocardia sp. NBC_01377 TaxID=2903595 RepID=UPI00386428B7
MITDLVGGSSNIVYVAAFTSMNESGPLVANIVGSILSTVIANELHRRLTSARPVGSAGSTRSGRAAHWP